MGPTPPPSPPPDVGAGGAGGSFSTCGGGAGGRDVPGVLPLGCGAGGSFSTGGSGAGGCGVPGVLSGNGAGGFPIPAGGGFEANLPRGQFPLLLGRSNAAYSQMSPPQMSERSAPRTVNSSTTEVGCMSWRRAGGGGHGRFRLVNLTTGVSRCQ
eukprot:365472-Chlamydomonas_euryale.AAC.2